MKDLRSRTVRAGGWVLGSRVVSQAISLLYGIVLARLLLPDDFGLIAMVMVFTGLAGLLSDVGLGAALIQKQDTEDSHYNSIFWLNILLGSILSASLYFAAPWISVFYGRVEIEPICKALSVVLFLGALTLVPRTLFAKGLLFKYLAITDLTAMLVSGAVAILLAASGFGYWSLVFLILLQQIISIILIWRLSHWRPKPYIKLSAIGDLIGFSSYVFATDFLQYSARNLDKLILGKVFGGDSLGVYDKALSMMLFPLQNISHVVGGVMFPSLSLIQADKERVKRIYLRSTSAIALVTFPMMAGIFVVSDSFVLGVIGPHWVELIPVLKIFCIAGVASSIVTVTGVIYKSQGASALQFRVNLFTQPVRIIGVIAGVPWGLQGVAIGYTASLFFNSAITLTVAGRLINLRLFTLLAALAPILVPSLAMAVMVWAIRPVLDLHNEFLLFMIQVISGAVIYWVFIFSLKLTAYHDIATVLREEFMKKIALK